MSAALRFRRIDLSDMVRTGSTSGQRKPSLLVEKRRKRQRKRAYMPARGASSCTRENAREFLSREEKYNVIQALFCSRKTQRRFFHTPCIQIP